MKNWVDKLFKDKRMILLISVAIAIISWVAVQSNSDEPRSQRITDIPIDFSTGSEISSQMELQPIGVGEIIDQALGDYDQRLGDSGLQVLGRIRTGKDQPVGFARLQRGAHRDGHLTGMGAGQAGLALPDLRAVLFLEGDGPQVVPGILPDPGANRN